MEPGLHRVYARYDETLWIGVRWFAQRTALTTDLEYCVLPVTAHRDVCLTLPDGRTLCDYGPRHDHNVSVEVEDG
jgi:hypothetical protein